jgi:hypothetical protein
VKTSDVLQLSRTADWTLLRVDTGSAPVIPRSSPNAKKIGERLVVFSYDSGNRVIGGVDIVGETDIPGLGKRFQIDPGLPAEAAGGPLLEMDGSVFGVIGGNASPGARPIRLDGANAMPGASMIVFRENQVTPVSEIPLSHPVDVTSLEKLLHDGILLTPVTPMNEIVFATTTDSLPKRVNDSLPRSVTQFSVRGGAVSLYSLWVKRGKTYKGEISGGVYDGLNHSIITFMPKRVSLTESQQIFGSSFSPAGLKPGTYRIDLTWNSVPAWRSYITIAE